MLRLLSPALAVALLLTALPIVLAQQAPAPEAARAGGMAAVKHAAEAQKYTFIFFFRDDNPATGAAWKAFQAATAKLTDRAESVAVNITRADEKETVDQYGVSRAPMPFVLAVAPNGAVTRGITGPLTDEQFQQAFVSPCEAQCMKALQGRKLVLVTIQKPGPQVTQVSLPQGVQDFKADKDLGPATEVVALNPSDAAEAPFLKELQVDPQTAQTVTVFMAPPGTLVGKFEGAVTKDQLAAKLKAAQSSCCPGGKCGPNGCK